MALPGHRPLTNVGPRAQAKRGRQRNEAAAVPQVNRQTLPYYRPPHRRRDLAEAAVILDGGAPVPMGSPADVAVASFSDATLLEVVIGNDDRVRVEQQFMGANPWRQICALRIRSQTGKMYVGTAWFIAPQTLATAGHCVFLQNEGGWPESIDVIPAKFGSSEPFARVKAGHFASVDGWVDGQSRDHDYGVIFVDDRTIGIKLGNFEVQSLGDGELNGVDAKISGYPADRDRAEFQYYHERPLLSITPTRLVYDIDTFGGQSGSPVWRDTAESGLIAIGIHTTGSATSNSGTRITDPILDNLIAWARE